MEAKEFAEHLRQAIDANPLKIVDIASKVPCNQSYVFQLLKGKRGRGQGPKLRALLRVIGQDPDEFLIEGIVKLPSPVTTSATRQKDEIDDPDVKALYGGKWHDLTPDGRNVIKASIRMALADLEEGAKQSGLDRKDSKGVKE